MMGFVTTEPVKRFRAVAEQSGVTVLKDLPGLYATNRVNKHYSVISKSIGVLSLQKRS